MLSGPNISFLLLLLRIIDNKYSHRRINICVTCYRREWFLIHNTQNKNFLYSVKFIRYNSKYQFYSIIIMKPSILTTMMGILILIIINIIVITIIIIRDQRYILIQLVEETPCFWSRGNHIKKYISRFGKS